MFVLSLAQAKRIAESLKANRCSSAHDTLQTRLDLCAHAQVLKEGDLTAMDSDALNVHLEALEDFQHIFPLDVMIKLAAKSCNDTLSSLTKVSLSIEKATKGGKNVDKDDKKKLEDLTTSFVQNSLLFVKDLTEEEFFEKPNFDPFKPSFHSIVSLILARKQDDLNTFDWPEGLAESLDDAKQLQDSRILHFSISNSRLIFFLNKKISHCSIVDIEGIAD